MWTKIVIKSCDAGAYMGNRDPIEFKKHKLHFKGSINVEEIFKYLQTKKIIANREEIVLAGSLNGAVAAMNYVDIFKQYTTAPIRLLIDSGLHLNEYNRKTNRT
jgi:fructose-1-phosphate kinase PfkB-like protein